MELVDLIEVLVRRLQQPERGAEHALVVAHVGSGARAASAAPESIIIRLRFISRFPPCLPLPTGPYCLARGGLREAGKPRTTVCPTGDDGPAGK
jgi:hypothetical protein